MKYLYDIVFCNSKDRQELYYKCQSNELVKCNFDGSVFLPIETSVDLLTYFNCFSIIKWKQYTTLKTLAISGTIKGQAQMTVFSIGKGGKQLADIHINGDFVKCFDLVQLSGEILGIKIKAVSDCNIHRISYSGDFSNWRDLKIGVTICTFNREEFVTKTIEKLDNFSNVYPWLTVLVVDNGSTLNELESQNLRIIHNPNYGGSGGFTRGLIENLRTKQNDYVLLMDDDIDLDTTSLNHMYGLLCGLKEEYKESFLSGAMLHMNDPCIQHENTAYWGKIRHHSLGNGWNLTKHDVLLRNESIKDYDNHYGAWWFCCIPLERAEKIGLPLPLFIKGDDIEYGIRNQRKLIHMNGIGVWHETLDNKRALWVNYYEYRNFFIINQYARDCNRWTLFMGICGRLFEQFIKGWFDHTKILKIAIDDAINGFERITEIPGNVQLDQIRKYNVIENSYFLSFLLVGFKTLYCLVFYKNINSEYIVFRETKLKCKDFWLDYLGKAYSAFNSRDVKNLNKKS